MREHYEVLISTDSVCDLPKEFFNNLPISFIPYYVVTRYGRFKDNVEIDARGLLASMMSGKIMAHSAAPEVEEYKEYFERCAESADQVIHLSMGKKVGKGYNNAFEAAKDIDNVTVVDTGQISSGMGIIVLKAATMAKNRERYEDICNVINELTVVTSSSFVVKNLDFMVRAERVSEKAKRLCDKLLLHPKLVMEGSGIKVKGAYLGKWAHVVDRYVKGTFKNIATIDKDVLFITHTGVDPNELEYIKALAERLVGFSYVFTVNAGSAISCNCGEGTFGLLFARKNSYHVDLRLEEHSMANISDDELLYEVNEIMAEENLYYGDAGLIDSEDYVVDEEDIEDIMTEGVGKPDNSISTDDTADGDVEPTKNNTMAKLKSVDGLETDVGLKYCMANEEFYLMVIKEYLTKDKTAILDECLKSEDFENYRINVHALKSTSLNIGAKELSNKAKKLELACKEADYGVVKEGHDSLMKQYKRMREQLSDAVL